MKCKQFIKQLKIFPLTANLNVLYLLVSIPFCILPLPIRALEITMYEVQTRGILSAT